MRNLPAPVPSATAPRQLSMALDSVRLRGMSSSERRALLARLAGLLMEAAEVAVQEHDDDEQ